MLLLNSRPMQHMSLYLLKDDVPEAAILLAQSQCFDISNANRTEQLLSQHYGDDYAREFDQALGRYKKIIAFFDINLTNKVKDVSPISYDKLQKTNEQLGEIWQQCADFEVRQRELKEQQRLISHLRDIWKNISLFDIDFSLLDETLNFLDIRLGIIPSVYVTRLKKSLTLEGYFLTEHAQKGESTHIVVAGLKEKKDKIQALLEAASFQNIHIPEELYGQPDKVINKIKTMENQYHSEYQHFRIKMKIYRNRIFNQIFKLGDVLTLAKPYTMLCQNMQGQGELVNVNGWILKDHLEAIKNRLQTTLGQKVVIITREPQPDEYSLTPSAIEHSKWITPFTRLVKHYGIPRYNEFDPSWFFSLSYILMFGIMFGDIGHGLSFISLGMLWRRKWPDFSTFLLSIGSSSVLFGFLYGSFFCYEHIVPALWIAPLSDPTLMLQTAFWWGVGFVILLNSISIYNRFSARNIRHALLDNQGFAGLLLYCAMIWLGLQAIGENHHNSYWLLVLLPLILMGINKWFSSQATHGERLLIIIIESYEIMINYLANTISFLRLAAFSLNHVALAITVFTLANMLDGSAHWLVIIFGNLFILTLEGAVVAIQTLRLEYYEGFSRFFYADGYQFEPLTLSPRKLL